LKPITTEGTNARLILPHEEELPDDERTGDLPAERCILVDEDSGLERPGFETVWRASDGERRALANGADVILRLWGPSHPPVNIHIGEPDPESMQILVSVDQTRRAATGFFEQLSKRMEDETPIDAAEIPKMFEESLKAIISKPEPEPRRNGNGA
jgi:hypothetical protein